MSRRHSLSLARLLYSHRSPSATTASASSSKSITAAAIATYRTIATPTCNTTPTSGRSIQETSQNLSSSFSHGGGGGGGYGQFLRNYSGAAGEEELDVNKVVDEINQKFAEAREEIDAAMDSKETVYFNEEAEIARTAVQEVLDMFEGLLGKVESKQRDSLMRSMGLKMEQLKGELQQLND